MPAYTKIFRILTQKERRRGIILLFIILIRAFLEMASVASIMPFMTLLGNPGAVETNPFLSVIFNRLGFADTGTFLFFLGVVVFCALVIAIAFRAFAEWVILMFSQMLNHSLSCRMFEGYLGRPYSWFLNRHSADLGKTVLSEANQVVGGVIMPLVQIIAQGTMVLFLIVLLVVMQPVLALMAALLIGGFYLSVYTGLRNYLSRIGADRVAANRERFQIAQEALGGIKEVKVFGQEQSFYNRYINPSYRFARNQVNSQLVAQVPRYFLEAVAFGSILLITLYLFRTHDHFGQILPLLAVYAFAGYKLMPAIQEVYQQLTRIRYGLPALDSILEDINAFASNEKPVKGPLPDPLRPKKAIRLEGIDYSYPGADKPVLENLNLNIPVCSTVGLVGATGSGKTTTVDLILGLLTPDKGRLLVDETVINQTNIRSWQRALGYVPQHIYLADDTVAANIAFGYAPRKIDMAAVEKAARIAEIHSFVVKELPSGYETLVGERGIRLSGGQRQRIGIARALYHNPSVLVMDEATSALDNVTEKQVMHAISQMKGERTIILIAHRLTTVKDCDTIFFLDQGILVSQGTYSELAAQNMNFRKMAISAD